MRIEKAQKRKKELSITPYERQSLLLSTSSLFLCLVAIVAVLFKHI